MQALATADPRNAEYQKSLSQALAWLADARMSKGELSDALQLRERQIALLNRLIAENAADVDYRSTLVPAEQAMARLLAMLGRREQATGHLRSAVEQAQRLVRTEPNNTIWLQQEFASRFALAEFGLALHGGEAIANANAGCATVQSLLAKDPSFPYWLAGAADCARLQAQLALAAGAKLEALTRAQQAVAIARSIKSNDRVGARFQLAKADRLVGDIRLALGDNPGAAAAWIEALRTIPAQVAERPLELDEHAVILQRLGRIQEASRLREALARMGYRS
jgi:tetratricopeptide (TPR) repeat protein